MKICLLGKVTPIQGGVSRQNFWLAYALAKQGHQVHLVTNANEVEEEYRLIGGRLDTGETLSPFDEVSDNLSVYFTGDKKTYTHIPFSNPFVSKLTSKAVEVIREQKCDIILSYYFEPYGVAGYFASKITGVPFGLRHAGSDVGRLLRHPDLNYLYHDMMTAADYVFCSNTTGRRFMHAGVDHDKLSILKMVSYPDSIYTPNREPLDIYKHIERAESEVQLPIARDLLTVFPVANFDADAPSIGIYGKVGETKGSFDLIAALGQLKKSGAVFNFLALTSGKPDMLALLKQKIIEADIADRTVWMPFVPHWNVPEFIKLCDAVCFLERDFSIPIHRPGVAMEILLSGGCLILSHEIANKQRFEADLIDKETVLLVDPKNIKELAEQIQFVFDNPDKACSIGLAGRDMLSAKIPSFDEITKSISDHMETTLEQINERKQEMSMLEYQSFINRLYTDDVFRKLNDIAPQEAQAFYQLTDEEKAALKQLDSKVVESFAGPLKVKLFNKIKGMYKLLFAVTPQDKIFALYERFYSLNPSYPGENKQALNIKFGEYIVQAIQSDDAEENYLSELARFEMIRNDVGLSTNEEDSFVYLNRKEQTLSSIELTDVITMRPNVRVHEFEYDLDKIVKQISAGQEVDNDVPKKPTHIIIYTKPAEFNTRVIKINDASAKLIELIRPNMSAAAIVNAFETQTGMSGVADKVLDLIKFLQENRIISVVR